MDRDLILTKLRELKPTLAHTHLKRMRLFGSYATGHATKNSDVDILLNFTQMPSLGDLSEIHVTLEEELGLEVDLSVEEYILPEFKRRILGEAVDV